MIVLSNTEFYIVNKRESEDCDTADSCQTQLLNHSSVTPYLGSEQLPSVKTRVFAISTNPLSEIKLTALPGMTSNKVQ